MYLSRPPLAVLVHEARRSGGIRTPEPTPILARSPLPVKAQPSFRDLPGPWMQPSVAGSARGIDWEDARPDATLPQKGKAAINRTHSKAAAPRRRATFGLSTRFGTLGGEASEPRITRKWPPTLFAFSVSSTGCRRIALLSQASCRGPSAQRVETGTQLVSGVVPLLATFATQRAE